jgi:hypothetical protein
MERQYATLKFTNLNKQRYILAHCCLKTEDYSHNLKGTRNISKSTGHDVAHFPLFQEETTQKIQA